MAMDLDKFRRLVALDPSDALSRFALGKKLFETADDDAGLLAEAAEHLRFANAAAPDHLATYHVLGQTLARLGLSAEARRVLNAGLPRANAVGGGMGRDLGPLMADLLAALARA